MDSQLKVSRAITKAAFSKPFYGSLLLSLRVQPSTAVPTAATDGRSVFWNDEFIQEQSEAQTLGLMCHEALHVAYGHCQPWPGMDKRLCNMAMDYRINDILRLEGLELPKEGLFDDTGLFTDMAWPEVYKILADIKAKKDQQEDNEGDLDAQPGDGSGASNGLTKQEQEAISDDIDKCAGDDFLDDLLDGNLSDAEQQQLKEDIERMVIQAAAADEAAGVGGVPGDIENLIKEIRTPVVDWREKVITDIRSRNPDDYSMRRPNRKFIRHGIYMPTMESNTIETLVIALDTSGSVSPTDMKRFLSEMNAISLEIKPMTTMVMYSDFGVAKIEEYAAGEEITELDSRGGGGTSFRPVFEYLEINGIRPDQLVYFSDMEVYGNCFPRSEPDFPVLWVSTRAEYDVPFGELVVAKEK